MESCKETERLECDSIESACNAKDPGLTPGLGRSFREENGHPLSCCLGNPMGYEPGGLQSIGFQKVRHD